MKKFLSMLLTVAIVLSTLCLPAVAEGEPVAQSGPAIGEVADGYTPVNGSKAINTLADLKAITDFTGNYHLTVDITVNITGADTDPTFPLVNGDFSGVFDGCGKKITIVIAENQSITASSGILFNKVGGTVKNLTIENAVYTASGSSGVLAAASTSGKPVTVTNVAITGAIITGNASDEQFIGGFLGNPGHSSTFVDCLFNGTLTNSKGDVGGFIGFTGGTSQYTFKGCSSTVTIKGTGGFGYGAGGFIGKLAGTARANFGVEDDVAVTANDVTTNPTYANEAVMTLVSGNTNCAGGLIGKLTSTRTKTINSIQSKDKDGNLLYEMKDGEYVLDDNGKKIPIYEKDAEANLLTYKQGDIVLLVQGTNTITMKQATTKDATTGAVKDVEVNCRVGGVVGVVEAKYSGLGYVDTDTTTGDSSVAASTGIININQNTTVNGTILAQNRAGGFFGQYSANHQLKMSRNGTDYAPTNNASVTGRLGTGGIIGCLGNSSSTTLEFDVVLNAVVNNGAIIENYTSSRDSEGGGGLIGAVQNINTPDGSTGLIKIYNNAKNTGAVTSTKSHAGGIIGVVHQALNTEILISNVSNSGTITGKTANYGAAGIVGAVVRDAVTIENCTNSGKITSTVNSMIGGIIGDYKSTSALKVTDCTNTGAISGKSNATHYAGGIIGRLAGAAPVDVVRCTNSGAVTASYAAGILGFTNKTATISISNCINTGKITMARKAGSAAAAGIMGATSAAATIVISNCHNGGEIAFGGTASVNQHYAGIMGWVNNTLANVTIQNCTNSGTIYGMEGYTVQTVVSKTEVTYQNSGAFIGKFIAEHSGTHVISHCINFNEAASTTYVGVGGGAGVASETAEGATSATVYDWQATAPDVVGCKYLNVEYAPTSTATMFQVLEGARIRVSSQGIADNGIRFDIAVDKALVDALVAAGYEEVEFHSLMARASSVNATNFTKESLDAMGEKFSDSMGEKFPDPENAAKVKDDGTYAAALINFSAEQYATEFACVGYLVATNGEETITLYTAYDADNARSIAYVADAALKDNANGQYNAYKTVLESFAQWLPAAN